MNTTLTKTKSTWQLQEAKNKFSQVVDYTAKSPQFITRRGVNTAVIMSFEDYQKFSKPKKKLKKLLKNSGLNELDIERDKSDTGRATPFDFSDFAA